MSSLPTACDIAFKEWARVCAAIRTGRQALLMRKGGIDEPTGLFSPQNRTFWLFPAQFHDQSQQGPDKLDSVNSVSTPHSESNPIMIDTFVEINECCWIDELDSLLELAGHHVWDEQSVRRKFVYRQPGIWLMLVRAYVLGDPFLVEPRAEYAGCKSWVKLHRSLSTRNLAPVLSKAEFANRCQRIQVDGQIRTMERH